MLSKKLRTSRHGRISRCEDRISSDRNDISEISKNFNKKQFLRTGIKSLEALKREKRKITQEININKRSSEHIQTKFDEIQNEEEIRFLELIQNLRSLRPKKR